MENCISMPDGYLRDGYPIELQGLLAYCLRTILDLKQIFSIQHKRSLSGISGLYD